MGRTLDSLRQFLDRINRLSLTGFRKREISAEDVRYLNDAQQVDEANTDRQVWVRGPMNGRH